MNFFCGLSEVITRIFGEGEDSRYANKSTGDVNWTSPIASKSSDTIAKKLEEGVSVLRAEM